MAEAQDLKLAGFVTEHLPMLRERLAPLMAIAFGSRVRGDALSTSDLDLVLVSPWFGAMSFLRRPLAVLELLCYTPEEFEEKRQELGIVRVAHEEGIVL